MSHSPHNRSARSIAELRVAIVGLGSIGYRHLQNLAACGVQHRLVVRRLEGANTQFTPAADVAVIHTADEALASGTDLAIICTPSAGHLESAAPFLRAGVPVLIEKPLDARLIAAQELFELAQHSSVYASVAYCMRFHQAYSRARDVIQSGELGEVTSAQAIFHTWLPDWHPWEDYRASYAARRELGGGVLPTLDHELDFLLWTLGPAEVTSARETSGREILGMDVPASMELQLQHRGNGAHGCESRVSLSLASREPRREFEFVGERGKLRFDLASGKLEVILSNDSEGGPAGGVQPRLLCQTTPEEIPLMYERLLRQVLRELASGAAPQTPLAAGLATARLCDAALRLAEAKQRDADKWPDERTA